MDYPDTRIDLVEYAIRAIRDALRSLDTESRAKAVARILAALTEVRP